MRIAWSCACACLLVAATAAAQPIAHFSPGATGYIADAFALRPDGRAVAYVVTDGAHRATLHIVELGGKDTPVAGVPVAVSALAFAGENRVLVIAHTSAGLTAQAFSRAGVAPPRLGPLESIELGSAHGRPALLTYMKRVHGALTEHVVAAYDLAHLTPVARATLHTDSKGQVVTRAGLLQPLWWEGGHATLAGLLPGAFDRAHDVQEPDRFVRFDVFGEKVLQSRAVPDVLALAAIAAAHRRHHEAVLAQFSDDHSRLELVDGPERRPLMVPRALSIYDPASLAYQELGPRQLAVSLTVEPMNPAAAARGRPDPNDTDLYVVDRVSGAARLALRIAGTGGRASWQVAANRVAVLRHDRGWAEGGAALEIYSLVR